MGSHNNKLSPPHEDSPEFSRTLIETSELFAEVKALAALEPSIKTLTGVVACEGDDYEIGFLTDSDEGKSARVTVSNKSTYDERTYEVHRIRQYPDTEGLTGSAWIEVLTVKPFDSAEELPWDSENYRFVINILHPFLKEQKEILKEEALQKEANRFARKRRSVSHYK